MWKQLEEVEIRDNNVQCHTSAIKTALGTLSNRNDMFTLHMLHDLESLKGWLASFISDISAPWMAGDARIEKNDLNVWDQC